MSLPQRVKKSLTILSNELKDDNDNEIIIIKWGEVLFKGTYYKRTNNSWEMQEENIILNDLTRKISEYRAENKGIEKYVIYYNVINVNVKVNIYFLRAWKDY